MKNKIRFTATLLLLFLLFSDFLVAQDIPVEPFSSMPSDAEKAFVDQWRGFLLKTAQADTVRYAPTVPFSFLCGERSSREWTKPEDAQIESGEWDGGVRRHLLQWKDAETSLVCLMELVEFADYPALEWTVSIRNEAEEESPKIHDFHSLDLDWNSIDAKAPSLYCSHGSRNYPDDFQFVGERMRISPTNRQNHEVYEGYDGRMSRLELPFFHYRTGDDGLLIGMGWNGYWKGYFHHEDGKSNLKLGMSGFDSFLYPGEQILTPRIALLYYQGRLMRGQNVFRQFLLTHHAPQADGKPATAPITLSGWGTDEANHLHHIKVVKENKIPFDAYWIDAAWYVDVKKTWWSIMGDWKASDKLYPRGLRFISEEAADAGMKFLLWAEPQRAMPGAQALKDHPDLFLRETSGKPAKEECYLVDLSKPEGVDYITSITNKMIQDYQVDYYREDYNINPGGFWRHADTPNRAGMTMVKFAEGYAKFWDNILAANPGLVIDNCAGGGARIELNALSRSMNLFRTDYNCQEAYRLPEETFNQGFDLMRWVVNQGAPMTYCDRPDGPDGPYVLSRYGQRSTLSPGISYPTWLLDEEHNIDPAVLRSFVEEAKRAKDYFYGDYYPLLYGGPDMTTWSAYHLYLPKEKRGMIVVLRRPESDINAMTFDLLTIDPAISWEFEDVDAGKTWTASGKEIREKGFPVSIPNRRDSRLFFYRAVPQ